MNTRVSVRKLEQVDVPGTANWCHVTINENGSTTHICWTDENGNGLWIDGNQIAGILAFSVGGNAEAAYRKYFSEPDGQHKPRMEQ